MFPGNLSGQELKLFIAGDARTTGTVEIPGLDFTQAFSVTPGDVTTVDLPSPLNSRALTLSRTLASTSPPAPR